MKRIFFASIGLWLGISSLHAQTMLTSFYTDHTNRGRPQIAAHNTEPFGTKFKVTYPKTGKSYIVVIGDRGPHVGNRKLDISTEAAKAIGMTDAGVARLVVERL